MPLQLDSLKKKKKKKRAPEFLERVINNAALLDSINKTDRCMVKVVENMSCDEFEEIYMSSRYCSKAAHNLIDFFQNTFTKVNIK